MTFSCYLIILGTIERYLITQKSECLKRFRRSRGLLAFFMFLLSLLLRGTLVFEIQTKECAGNGTPHYVDYLFTAFPRFNQALLLIWRVWPAEKNQPNEFHEGERTSKIAGSSMHFPLSQPSHFKPLIRAILILCLDRNGDCTGVFEYIPGLTDLVHTVWYGTVFRFYIRVKVQERWEFLSVGCDKQEIAVVPGG
ncbi:hypothetical protein ANCDUO_20909 [Ancylostoma duodenale]|uniref:Uncharacterized protein n=1 Tax=Ancylostoma duodenale TaxID=51022 RepID=A0A0C2CGV3_9BILA|nr:hypothetical protein ANCDUO_20909 [Ancylostoma duodenale]